MGLDADLGCQMISYLSWILRSNWWLPPSREGAGTWQPSTTGTFNSLLPHKTAPSLNTNSLMMLALRIISLLSDGLAG